MLYGETQVKTERGSECGGGSESIVLTDQRPGGRSVGSGGSDIFVTNKEALTSITNHPTLS